MRREGGGDDALASLQSLDNIKLFPEVHSLVAARISLLLRQNPLPHLPKRQKSSEEN